MKGGNRIPMSETEVLVGLRLVGQGTAEQIGNAILRGRRAVLGVLKKLEAEGVVHICGWQPTPGQCPGIYKLGKGVTPPVPSRAESYRQWAELHPDESQAQRERRSRAALRSKLRQFLTTDQRGYLEKWACPDLSRLPRSIYFTGA